MEGPTLKRKRDGRSVILEFGWFCCHDGQICPRRCPHCPSGKGQEPHSCGACSHEKAKPLPLIPPRTATAEELKEEELREQEMQTKGAGVCGKNNAKDKCETKKKNTKEECNNTDTNTNGHCAEEKI